MSAPVRLYYRAKDEDVYLTEKIMYGSITKSMDGHQMMLEEAAKNFFFFQSGYDFKWPLTFEVYNDDTMITTGMVKMHTTPVFTVVDN
jgi:hypothetical protein